MLKRLFLSFGDVDWARTKAFAVGNFGQIYLNVRGQRVQGIVEPGAEYEAVREQIIRSAVALRDPDSGDQVIAQVYKKEELYHGDRVPLAPDLILHTDRSKYVSFGHVLKGRVARQRVSGQGEGLGIRAERAGPQRAERLSAGQARDTRIVGYVAQADHRCEGQWLLGELVSGRMQQDRVAQLRSIDSKRIAPRTKALRHSSREPRRTETQ